MDAEEAPAAYFQRLDEVRFRPTRWVGGAWDPRDQHIAPLVGLITHVIERDRDARRDDGLVVGRLSVDILGTIPVDDIRFEVRVLRAGRTIELVEAVVSHDGRPAVNARVWLMQPRDTAAIAGTALPPMPPRSELAPWTSPERWEGAFVTTIDVRCAQEAPGRGRFWMRTRLPLLEGEPVSDTAHAMSIVDIANGIVPRVEPSRLLYPNLDLTVHLFRRPTGAWTGFDTTVSYGPDGIGQTASILHDEHGPIGTSQQILTLRPR